MCSNEQTYLRGYARQQQPPALYQTLQVLMPTA